MLLGEGFLRLSTDKGNLGAELNVAKTQFASVGQSAGNAEHGMSAFEGTSRQSSRSVMIVGRTVGELGRGLSLLNPVFGQAAEGMASMVGVTGMAMHSMHGLHGSIGALGALAMNPLAWVGIPAVIAGFVGYKIYSDKAKEAAEEQKKKIDALNESLKKYREMTAQAGTMTGLGPGGNPQHAPATEEQTLKFAEEQQSELQKALKEEQEALYKRDAMKRDFDEKDKNRFEEAKKSGRFEGIKGVKLVSPGRTEEEKAAEQAARSAYTAAHGATVDAERRAADAEKEADAVRSIRMEREIIQEISSREGKQVGTISEMVVHAEDEAHAVGLTNAELAEQRILNMANTGYTDDQLADYAATVRAIIEENNAKKEQLRIETELFALTHTAAEVEERRARKAGVTDEAVLDKIKEVEEKKMKTGASRSVFGEIGGYYDALRKLNERGLLNDSDKRELEGLRNWEEKINPQGAAEREEKEKQEGWLRAGGRKIYDEAGGAKGELAARNALAEVQMKMKVPRAEYTGLTEYAKKLQTSLFASDTDKMQRAMNIAMRDVLKDAELKVQKFDALITAVENSGGGMPQ